MLRNGVAVTTECCIIRVKDMVPHSIWPTFYQPKCSVSTGVSQCAKKAVTKSQIKLLGKLFGQRLPGSKKRWYPTTDSRFSERSAELFSGANLSSVDKKQGKNTTRRMAVLNKLFMQHITDLLATGEASEKILGRGLQVTRVKISSDFTFITVFWNGIGELKADQEMENDLQACSGFLRHELSQLCLMSKVPRISFVRDRTRSNVQEVEALLRNMDFGDDYEEKDMANELKLDFYSESMKPNSLEDEGPATETVADNIAEPESIIECLPIMRHDTLGLDHRDIMMKIFTKMRKSKQAWELHEQGHSLPTEASLPTAADDGSSRSNNCTTKLDRVKQKLTEAADVKSRFDKFLTNRNISKNKPYRKKFHKDSVDVLNQVDAEFEELDLHSKHFNDVDYISEDESGKN